MTPDRPYSSDAASSITSKPLAAARLGHALPEVTGFQKAIDGACDLRRVADGYEQAVDSILDEFPTNPGVRRNQELSIRLSFDVDKPKDSQRDGCTNTVAAAIKSRFCRSLTGGKARKRPRFPVCA